MDKVEKYLKESIGNIRNDRALALDLLSGIMNTIKTANDNREDHKNLGPVAAKYLETLQRSNEQLVKATSLLQKMTSGDTSLTSEDREQIFDLINLSDTEN
tara:strand:+ start:3909 stop:4211 length:303 start_codon:yes stop_codon:yes gene_type:complete